MSRRPRRFLRLFDMAQYAARRLLGAPVNVAASVADDGRVEFCLIDALGNGVWTATDLPLKRKFQTGRELRAMATNVFGLTESMWRALDAENLTLH